MTRDNNQLDLERLRARLREKPRTKIGQVRQAWPYIKELFDAGHSLEDVWAWLNEIGINIGYAGLSHYVGQLRRSDRQRAIDTLPAVESAPSITQLETMGDPELVAPAPEESTVRPLTNLVHRDVCRYNGRNSISGQSSCVRSRPHIDVWAIGRREIHCIRLDCRAVVPVSPGSGFRLRQRIPYSYSQKPPKVSFTILRAIKPIWRFARCAK